METFQFANGKFFVHPKEQCEGEACVLHHPSLHPMIEEPMIVRESGLVERLCIHGVGHPDPDSVAYFLRAADVDLSIHGCDGCCGKLDLPT